MSPQSMIPAPPPGYSQEDIVGASDSSMPAPPPGYSASDIVSAQPSSQVTDKQPSTLSDALTIGSGKYSFNPVNATENFAKGAEGTVAGVSDLIHRIPVIGDKLVPSEGLNAMDKQASSGVGTTIDKAVGYGGETLMEFLMGDEALKGMSLAERLAKSAQVAKALEQSPRLMNALKLGASIGKANATLGPEERALIQKYPIIARLVGAGMDAVRAGVTQGGETAAKTKGGVGERVKQGAKEGAEMTAGAAAVGAPLATAGGILTKGGEAAKTVSAMGKAAEDAQPQEAITQTAQDMVSQANKDMHARYEQGVQDLSHDLHDQSIDYEGSPLHEAAQELSQKGAVEGKPLDEAFSKTRPGSKGANDMLDMLANPGAEDEEEAAQPQKWVDANGVEHTEDAPAAADEEKPPIKLGVNELIERRQLLGERMRNLGYATAEDRADRAIYSRLIDGIDDTIKSLGDQTENPQVSKRLEEMNTDYRQNVKLFGNKDVQSLLKGNVNDVAARIARGETSMDDIDAVRKTIGQQNMAQLSTSIFDRWLADAAPEGKFDPEKLLKKWNSTKPEVRDELFGMKQTNFVKTPGTTGQPQSPAQAYQGAIKKISDAASVKKLVKYGVLPPLGAAAGAATHGTLGALVGFLAGSSAEGAAKATGLLDYVANHPNVWKSLGWAGEKVNKPAAEVARRVAGYGGGKAITTAVNSLSGGQ